MDKINIMVRADNFRDEVEFSTESGQVVARARGREKSEWLVLKKVWSLDLSLELTKALQPTRKHYAMALKQGKGYSFGGMSKSEAIREAKKAIRAPHKRGTINFVEAS